MYRVIKVLASNAECKWINTLGKKKYINHASPSPVLSMRELFQFFGMKYFWIFIFNDDLVFRSIPLIRGSNNIFSSHAGM